MEHRDDPADQPTSELEEEGVPDHLGPLPDKARTGDPQEGHPPPRDAPGASVDWGTTAREERAGESLDRRLAREEPRDESAEPENRRAGRVVDPSVEGTGTDTERDEIGEERLEDRGDYSAEERAVRVREEVDETDLGPAPDEVVTRTHDGDVGRGR